MRASRFAVPLVLLLAAACAAGGAPSLQGGAGPAPVRIRLGDGTTTTTGVSSENAIARTPLAHPAEAAWRQLPAAFRALGLEVNTGDPRARILGVENLRVRSIDGARPSRFLDCGTGVAATPNADRYEVVLTLLAQVAPSGAEASELQVQLQAMARDPEHGGAPVRCASKGTLESRVREVVEGLLAGTT